MKRSLALRTALPVRWVGCVVLALTALHVSAQTPPQGALLPKDSRDAAIFRGGLVYANYCVTCHGISADGNGRAARIYNPRPVNLRASDKNDDYFALIIRRGGAALGRSDKMPPWGEELTDEQVGDLVTFVRSINAVRP